MCVQLHCSYRNRDLPSSILNSRSWCTCRSESCAVVMLAGTWAEGDNPCALMLGSAVNQDGRASSLTAPNGPSQASVIREALATAGVETAMMQSLHLHGTGTPLVSCCFCIMITTKCMLARFKNLGKVHTEAGFPPNGSVLSCFVQILFLFSSCKSLHMFLGMCIDECIWPHERPCFQCFLWLNCSCQNCLHRLTDLGACQVNCVAILSAMFRAQLSLTLSACTACDMACI